MDADLGHASGDSGGPLHSLDVVDGHQAEVLEPTVDASLAEQRVSEVCPGPTGLERPGHEHGVEDSEAAPSGCARNRRPQAVG
jgi:hypothetical protein